MIVEDVVNIPGRGNIVVTTLDPGVKISLGSVIKIELPDQCPGYNSHVVTGIEYREHRPENVGLLLRGADYEQLLKCKGLKVTL
jgi:translation elongation factor EF-Tu-like GTPase